MYLESTSTESNLCRPTPKAQGVDRLVQIYTFPTTSLFLHFESLRSRGYRTVLLDYLPNQNLPITMLVTTLFDLVN